VEVLVLNIRGTLIEVIQSIIPLALIIIILRFIVTGISGVEFFNFIVAVLITIIGFTLFLIGVRLSLITIGEMIGRTLVTKGNLWYVLGWVIIMGFVITIAEPGVQILANQVTVVSNESISNTSFIIFISLGVGIFLGLALLRIIFKVPLLWLLGASYALVLILGIIVSPDYLAVAFDAGGVTTGPMTVPFILSLGIGVTSVMGSRRGTQDNFGLVGLASVGPIIAVLIMGVVNK
jgi:hypothetical protein